jgi:uncharacterized protein DUF3298/peptidoglycan-N-acetylmuramic acid deacetylase PdaC-like protein
MNSKGIMVYILILTTLKLMSQNDVYYGRYEGVVDSSFQVTANIVRLFDNLSGYYYYKQINNEVDPIAGNSFSIQGKVNNNIAEFKEFGNDGNVIVGVLSKESFNGTWTAPGNNLVDLIIEENYPEGTIPFDVHYLHSEDILDPDNLKSPVAEIELTLIYPIVNINYNGIVDSVSMIITTGFFGNNFINTNPDSMLTNFEEEYYTNYKDQNADRIDNGASFSWQKIVNMSVLHNSNYLLCVEYLKYAYSGGAHGMTNIAYDNIDLENGKLLVYEDIFGNDTRDSISVLLTKQLYIDKKIPADLSLKDAGFFVESIIPNHNFYLNNNGVGFLYNSYEIAPYSFGQTRVFLSFDKIKKFISNDSPYYRFHKKKRAQ